MKNKSTHYRLNIMLLALLTIGLIAYGATSDGHQHSETDAAHSHGATEDGHKHDEADAEHKHGATEDDHKHDATDVEHKHAEETNGHKHDESDTSHSHGATVADTAKTQTQKTDMSKVDKPDEAAAEHAHSHPSGTSIDISEIVRKNLGITFIKAQQRPVHKTLRVPGQFELTPEARRDYLVMIGGRIEIKVKQFDQVKPNQVLFTLNSIAWHELQENIAASIALLEQTKANITVAKAILNEKKSAIVIMEKRLKNLATAKVRAAELETTLAQMRNALPRLQVELKAKHAALPAAEIKRDLLLRKAAYYSGYSVKQLLEIVKDAEHGGKGPRWKVLHEITFKALAGGVVETLDVTNGSWAESGKTVCRVIDPKQVRFIAHAPQIDLAKLKNGLVTQISPPRNLTNAQAATGPLKVGYIAHPQQRSIPLYTVLKNTPTWAKPGMTGYMDIFIDGNAKAMVAVPRSCVVRDGLNDVLFVRDPHDVNKVIRVEAELGVNDGRWVVVKKGLKAGDQIVLDGAYELKLASSGTVQEGGHFHGDGTFHKGDEH